MKDWTKYTKYLLISIWALFFIAIVSLPDHIPSHWGFDLDAPNRWSHKIELVMIPVSFSSICIFLMALSKTVRGETYADNKSSSELLVKTAFALSIVFCIIFISILSMIVINL